MDQISQRTNLLKYNLRDGEEQLPFNMDPFFGGLTVEMSDKRNCSESI